jgi:translation initiation factor 2 subunit 3
MPMTAKKESEKDAKQPVINIGLIGHVDHGKTTLTERLSGKWTDTHSEEIKRGITIRLGYADTSFYKCSKCGKYGVNDKCECGGKAEFLRKVSFIDAPGHESLMATMLSGATIMDGALLIVAANEKCPQPQTREHLMALQISGITNVVIVQNKIDLVSEEEAMKNYEQIKTFIKGTPFENAPIIPISARQRVGLSSLIESIEKTLKTPKRDLKKDPLMLVARSFDINKPGTMPKDMLGGVLGGAVIQGKLEKGQEIEIKPGLEVEEKNQKVWKPIITKILDLKTGGISVKDVTPGGSMAVMTSLDPSIVKSDKLAGSVVGIKGKLPPIWNEIVLETHLLDRVVGTKEETQVEPIKQNESLMLNVNAAATVGIVTRIKKEEVTCKLKLVVCANIGSRVTVSRLVGNRFRLIGYGLIKG